MKTMKKKCSAFLCLVLACLMMTTIVPTFSMDVQAATNINVQEVADTNMYSRLYMGTNVYYNGSSGNAFRIEAGQKVSIGDLFYFSTDNGNQSAAQVKGTTYTNSNKSIASISAKGVFTAKKPGEAVVTVSSKGNVKSCFIQIVKKGALKMNASKYKKLHDYAKKLSSYQSKKITAKNGYAVANLWSGLKEAASADRHMYITGFYTNSSAKGTYFNTKYTGCADLVEPKLVELNGNHKLDQYINSNNPRLVKNKNHFEVSKVAGTKNTKVVTVSLKKKVTADQILALKYNSSDSYIQNDKQAVFYMWVTEAKTGYRYKAEACATQGSNKLILRTNYLKLKKGTTYRVADIDSRYGTSHNWTKNKTFKVK